jgi:hypothetical protein
MHPCIHVLLQLQLAQDKISLGLIVEVPDAVVQDFLRIT